MIRHMTRGLIRDSQSVFNRDLESFMAALTAEELQQIKFGE